MLCIAYYFAYCSPEVKGHVNLCLSEPCVKRKKRCPYSKQQIRELEKEFLSNIYINKDRCVQLSCLLHLTDRCVDFLEIILKLLHCKIITLDWTLTCAEQLAKTQLHLGTHVTLRQLGLVNYGWIVTLLRCNLNQAPGCCTAAH